MRSKGPSTKIIYRAGRFHHSLAIVSIAALKDQPSVCIIHEALDENLDGKTQLSHLIEKAEQTTQVDISRVSIVVPSSMTVCHDQIPDDLMEEHELLYKTDAPEGSRNLYFLAPKTELKKIVRAFNAVGLQVSEFLDERFLLAYYYQDAWAGLKNVVFADIGHRHTSLYVYSWGQCQAAVRFPLGTQHFVSDLSSGLQVDLAEARKICFNMGLASDRFMPMEHPQASDAVEPSQVCNWRNVVSYLAPRAKELASLMAKSLITYKGQLEGGLRMGGVGAAIPGLSDCLSDLLRIRVESISLSMKERRALMDTAIHANGWSVYDPSAYFCHILHASAYVVEQVGKDGREKSGILRHSLRGLSTWLKELS